MRIKMDVFFIIIKYLEGDPEQEILDPMSRHYFTES